MLAINVPDLNFPVARLIVLLNVDVDGEVGIDVTQLVLVALGHADDEVVDDGADGAEGGDVLAGAVVDLDPDDVLLDDREADGNVAQVLAELAARALDRDQPRLDRDLDCKSRTLKSAFYARRSARFPPSPRVPLSPNEKKSKPPRNVSASSPADFCWCRSQSIANHRPLELFFFRSMSSDGGTGRGLVKRTVLGDLEGLLTVDVAHLCVWTWT